jgi:hypothetical protein
MASAEQFREAKKTPFQPFRFRLVDGTVYAVNHPDWISVPPAPRAREIFYFAVNELNKNRYDTHRIDLGLVTEVILPPNDQAPNLETSPDSNGPDEGPTLSRQ